MKRVLRYLTKRRLTILDCWLIGGALLYASRHGPAWLWWTLPAAVVSLIVEMWANAD